jgi:hypothetical protein
VISCVFEPGDKKIVEKLDRRMNDLAEYARIFDGITPWSGVVPRGYRVDFLGVLTDVAFDQRFGGEKPPVGGSFVKTVLPVLDNMNKISFDTIINWRGEGWFEAVNWFAAAADARNSFVMITLGAWHGSQAVGSHHVLQRINPMPCTLVAVEPVLESIEFTRQHFQDNGIEPNDHWLVPMAITDRNEPVLFAIGPRQAGPQNCVSTNEPAARENYYRHLVESGKAEQAVRDLLLRNSTGITIPGQALVPDGRSEAEIKYVSSVTLNEVLGPFDIVDYLESDIQQSEILAFPPFMDLLKRKVRRIHIGTHGKAVHETLHDLFARDEWNIIFNYEPDCVHETMLGTFRTNDGILTVRNPDF